MAHKRRKSYTIWWVLGAISILILGIIIGITVIKYNSEKNIGGKCTLSNDGMDSNCNVGLLCNVGSGRMEGVCNTVQQCISSGSTADAVEGSKVCFQGV